MTRHFYKHKITGIIAPLDDAFAEVFVGRFERVGDATDSPAPIGATPAPAADSAVAPAPDAASADASPANAGTNP